MEHETPTGSVTVTVPRVPREMCDYCGEIFYGPVAAKKRNRYLGKALGLLSSTDIRKIRKAISRSRGEFCRLTGIAEDTIMHWEEGKTLPTQAMDRYLRFLSRSPLDAKKFLGRLVDQTN